jgi:hypothetical protein
MRFTGSIEVDTLGQERRRAPRYPFVASADLVETESRIQLSARVTDLSLYGCYFETMNPFPAGRSILIKIVSGPVFFKARGTVVYSQANRGMGVEFQALHPSFLKVLQGWLLEAERARGTPIHAKA